MDNSVVRNFKVIEGGNQKEKSSALKNFINACVNSDIPMVGHMLTSKMHKKVMSEIMETNAGLCCAAQNGNWGVVKLITNSDLFDKTTEKQYFLDEALFFAVNGGHLKIISYLLDSVELKDKANLNAMEKRAFWLAAFKGEKDIVDYFMLEKEMEIEAKDYDYMHDTKNSIPKESIEQITNIVVLKQVQAMFDAEGMSIFNEPKVKLVWSRKK